jgi:hypothetical protein
MNRAIKPGTGRARKDGWGTTHQIQNCALFGAVKRLKENEGKPENG